MKLKNIFKKNYIIGASILSSNLSKLYETSNNLLKNGVDYLHLDVMDGHFVPNLTIGPPVISSLRNELQNAFFDVHLMVSNPEQWIKPLSDCKTNLFVFHVEAFKTNQEIINCINKVTSEEMEVGIAFKPNTNIDDILLKMCTNLVQVILIMSVEPGFGGQSFMEKVLEKVIYIKTHFPNFTIQIDGGINVSNIGISYKAGVQMFVCGTSIVKYDYQSAMTDLSNEIEKFN
ncbi:hypothetical protein A3Q56_03216 [Intoshia linei]|uniref:ribulose-phosphate 3-epimerase n=1 Tax=Intoshia linei TaxID=1819745 RepID=A0A177B6H0_9BILA|nr:hypothetical protein A3Q56_03216 [Intoshia linei]